MTENKKRIFLARKIVQFESGIDQLMQELNQFEWDFEGEPAILDKQILKAVLTRYANGDLSVNEVYKWADFLELRDDIDFAESDEEKISEIMHALANPILEGKLTPERAQKWLSELL